ncbi:MAG: hypothetical protein HDR01_12135 [Lachnospiraceae bacterium]|nr:hypothetical protein [Lachnospiraceae bacterium]
MKILDFSFSKKLFRFLCSTMIGLAMFGSFTCSVHAQEAVSLNLIEISRPKDAETDFNGGEAGKCLEIPEDSAVREETRKIVASERSYIIIIESHKRTNTTWGSKIDLYSNASLTSEISALSSLSADKLSETSYISYWYVEAGTYYLTATNAGLNVNNDKNSGGYSLTLHGYVLPVSKVLSVNVSNANCAAASVKTDMKVAGESFSTMLMADESDTKDIRNTSSVWNTNKNAKVTADPGNQYSITANGKYALRVEFTSDEWKKYPFDVNFTVSSLKAHAYSTITIPATTTADGNSYSKCSVCGATAQNTAIYKIGKVSLAKTSYTYTGKSIKPTVSVTDAGGLTIGKTNYTVSYKNNKTPGKATVTIKFKGNYTGTVTKTFTIKPKAAKISKATGANQAITVKWSQQKGDGYEVQYSTSRSFAKKKTTTVTVKSASSKSRKLTKLKTKTKYYIRVRTYKTISGKKVYSAWSNVKTAATK